MSLKNSQLLYLGSVALFAAVLLWAQDATLAAVLVTAGLLAGLLAFAAWQIRRAQRVLVVGRRSLQTDRLEEAAERAGYDVCWCGGPSERPCPVFLGNPCPLTERPDAALVFRATDERGRYAPCGSVFNVPEVIVEERLDAEPAPVGNMMRVGFERGPERVVSDLQHLLS